MSTHCIFCAIAEKKAKASIVYETDTVVAFNDINKAAEVHVLIIPKKHLSSLNEIDEKNAQIMIDLTLAAKKLTAELGILDSGYRLVINTGPDGGQTVFHLHMHLLGGRSFTWPPG